MFVPLLDAPGPPDEFGLVISVRGSHVAIAEGAPGGDASAIFLGTLSGRQCWAVDVDGDGQVDGYSDLRMLWSSVDERTWAVAGRAVQLVEWTRTHRFCGRCATPTETVPGERAVKCPACGLQQFPRLSPAVIMLVQREDGAVLLGRNAMFPAGMFSCLAGFVEPGETLEEAVRREVLEEVGVVVDRLDYFGSQPWPFPHQLMIGFVAHYVSGEVTIDGTEIVEADWFTPDTLPMTPPSTMSIAGRLIDAWRTSNPAA